MQRKRALEPLEDLEQMARRRGIAAGSPRQLCSGPGKLTQALGIELADARQALRFLRDTGEVVWSNNG